MSSGGYLSRRSAAAAWGLAPPRPAVSRRRGWCTLIALSICLALLVCPSIAGATGYGTLSGKVTGAVSKAALANVEVRAYESEHEWYPATTNSKGEYSINGAEAGEYRVDFIGGATKFASQYYREKLSYGAATPVVVESGKETKEINAALSESGSISGEVTSAITNLELGSIEVTAYEKNVPNAVVESSDTNEFGKYELKDLSKGSYVVGFRAASTGLDYAPQFYPEKPRFTEASEVYVDEDVASDVNAKLSKGASITGVITDAATHQPVAGIIVYAVPVGGGEMLAAAALSAANGSYELVGLASGTFEVAFISEKAEGAAYPTYFSQIYDDRTFPETLTSFTELLLYGTHLEVTVPLTTAGIDAALVREEPANTVAPALSGTPSPGQTLSCANGSWTGLEPLTYTQQWLRDGTAIPGASGSTYVVQAGDRGHGLACQVTAANKVASVSATSNTLAVPLPASAEPAREVIAPVVTLPSAKITVSKGTAGVTVSCTKAKCVGTLELSEQIVVKHRQGHRTVSSKQTVVLAKGAYSVAAGHSATIALHLSAAGRSALASAKLHRLHALLTASLSGGKTAERQVALSERLAARHS